jgi:hypothetical protein
MPVKLTAAEARKFAGGQDAWRRSRKGTGARKPIGADFAKLCTFHGIPVPVPEYRFAPPRRWRFDWAWPDRILALEIDGGVWTGGRHTRGAGFIRDQEKRNEAVLRGWAVLHCTPKDMTSGAVFVLLRRAFEGSDLITEETGNARAQSKS